MRLLTTLAMAMAMAMALGGCGSLPYQPGEYAVRDGLPVTVPVRGTVHVRNAQPATGAVTVYMHGGARLASSLNVITEAMVVQVRRELQPMDARTGHGAPKEIALRVDSLLSRHGGGTWQNELVFQATLGDGRVVRRTVPHTGAPVLHALDGCISQGVAVLLADPAVRSYLAQ